MDPTPVEPRRRALALIAATLGVALAGCGGGDAAPAAPTGQAPADPPPPPSPPAPTPAPPPPAPPPPPPNAVTAALATGTTFDYLASASASSASPDGTRTSSDFGLFRLTLDAAVLIDGVPGFRVAVSGKTLVGGHEFRPAWRFLALAGTRWLGSADGATWTTLFDPALPAGTSGFFLGATAARPLAAAGGRHSGAYNTFDGIALGDADREGGCREVLGLLEICSDSTTEFLQREVLVDGIGPAAFSQRVGYSVGGSAPQVLEQTLSLELVGTTLAARDGSVVRPPPWRVQTQLPVARSAARAVALGGRVYLFGGSIDEPQADGRRVDVFDLTGGRWQRAPDAPRSLAVARPVVVGSRIALFIGTQGLLFDPARGTWSSTASLAAPGIVTGAGSRQAPDGSTEVLAIVDRGVAYAQASLVRWRPADDRWETIGPFERGPRENYEALLVGDRFFLIGGYADGSYVAAVSTVDVTTGQTQRQHALLPAGLVAPAVTVQHGRIVVAGGFHFGGTRREVHLIDPASGSVTAGPALLGGLQAAAAATVDDQVLLLGGLGGDLPTPAADVWRLAS